MKKPKPVQLLLDKQDDLPDMLSIPDPDEGQRPLYGITPGYYNREGVVALLRYHKHNPKAIQFIADMFE